MTLSDLCCGGSEELKPVVLPLLISLLFLGGTTRAGQSFFDEGDVSSLVRLAKLNGTVSYKRLAQLVKQHGIDFEPSESYLEGLQKAGAKKVLLEALRSAKRVDQRGRDMRSVSSVYGVGAEVIPLVPIYKPDPPYSESARRAKLNGVLVLWVVIGPGGEVVDIKEVSKPLGQGLDDKAIHTLSTWKFEPPTRNGAPVAIHTHVEISFRTF